MQAGLEGVRVLEFGGGVGLAWAAKLFADLGADVLRVEAVDEVVRRRPHEVARWLNTNKRSVSAGVDVGVLVEGVDIVLHDRRPSEAVALGLGYEELSARNVRVVVGSITPFGATGPYAEYRAEELTVMHASSWGFLSPGGATDPALAPIKAYGHHLSIVTATLASTAVLAAFDRAERSGRGEQVDFSTFAAALKTAESSMITATYKGLDSSRLGVKTVAPWGIYACSDGLMQIITPEQSQWEALVELMGRPEWAVMDAFATPADRHQNADLLDVYLAEWVAGQSIEELYRSGQAVGLCVTPVYTMDQLPADRQLIARDFFAETPDGLPLPGPGFKSEPSWWALRRSAPEAGANDGEGWVERPEPPAPEVASAPGGRPLEGVRVCDFSWVWAGPYCTMMLAHLGADVIRLESSDRPCLLRRMPFNPPDLPATLDNSGFFHAYNSDKRSLAIDIRHEDAKEIIGRLVAESDVVIDNFSVGTMAKLGFSVEDLRAMNPDVIVISLSGYGQTGPSADYVAYGTVGPAIAGVFATNGYEGDAARETGIPAGDPGMGLMGAWSIVAALVARRRHGQAARIDVAMVEAIAATVGEAWMAYLAEGTSPTPAANHDPQWAPHNCYPAAGDDHWVTIACTTDDQWQTLAALIDPILAEDPRYHTATDRKTNETELDKVITAWTTTRDRWETTHLLQAHGIAAMPSLSPLELWTGDPQLQAIGMLETPDHPTVGTKTVPGIPWRLTNGPNGLRRPAPLLGQHTHEILTDLLGYQPDQIDHLTEIGAIS